MFGSEILDVALGITLVFLLLSLVATAMREAVESWVKARAVHLERGIRALLDDPNGTGLARQLYEHPLVFSLFQGPFTATDRRLMGGNLPTYIPSSSFAGALIDLLARGPATTPTPILWEAPDVTVESLRASLDRVENPRVRRALVLAIDGSAGDMARVRAKVEAWFNDAMDRVSGAYRRRTQYGLFAIAVIVSVALNVDAINIANYLWRNKAARQALAQRAEAVARDTSYARTLLTDSARSEVLLSRQLAELQALDLPIGWKRRVPKPIAAAAGAAGTAPVSTVAPTPQAVGSNEGVSAILTHVFGLLVTIFAITLGAPFWFDALKRIMIIRSTVKPGEKAATADSKAEKGGMARADVTPASGAPPVHDAGRQVASGTGSGTEAWGASPAAATSPARPVAPAGAEGFTAHEWDSGNPNEGLL